MQRYDRKWVPLEFDVTPIAKAPRKQSPMLYMLLCYALLPPKTMLGSWQSISPGDAFGAGAILGFWYAPWILRRYQLRQRLKAVWGWPRFSVVDLLSLSVWIGLILGLARNAWQFHPVRYYEYSGQETVKLSTVLAVFFCVYLWFRATWLLQQCGAQYPLRRMVFLLGVLPAALLCNVDAAISLVLCFDFCAEMLFGEPRIGPLAFAFLFELILLTTMIHHAMRYVLDENKHAVESAQAVATETPMSESNSP